MSTFDPTPFIKRLQKAAPDTDWRHTAMEVANGLIQEAAGSLADEWALINVRRGFEHESNGWRVILAFAEPMTLKRAWEWAALYSDSAQWRHPYHVAIVPWEHRSRRLIDIQTALSQGDDIRTVMAGDNYAPVSAR